MDHSHITALLIEDNRGDVLLIERMLASRKGGTVGLETASRLDEGLTRIDKGGIDVVLLDLGLPDSNGLDTVRRARAHAPDIPIIVLTGHDDEVLGANVVWAGAQDYLVKGQVDATLLARAIRYAIGRQAIQAGARGHSIADELTGLYNRRGFLALVEQQLKLARRRRESLSLLSARIHDLAKTRETLGGQEADHLVLEAAQVVQGALRSSDIMGRVGVDELAVLAVDAAEDEAARIIRRLRKHLLASKRHDPSLQKLSLVLGAAIWEPNSTLSAEELLREAREPS